MYCSVMTSMRENEAEMIGATTQNCHGGGAETVNTVIEERAVPARVGSNHSAVLTLLIPSLRAVMAKMPFLSGEQFQSGKRSNPGSNTAKEVNCAGICAFGVRMNREARMKQMSHSLLFILMVLSVISRNVKMVICKFRNLPPGRTDLPEPEDLPGG